MWTENVKLTESITSGVERMFRIFVGYWEIWKCTPCENSTKANKKQL